MIELILFILFVVVLLLFKSPRSIGERGERKVQNKIAKLVSNEEGFRVFNDLTLETPDGTTQIDHIILSHFGIFVIETKNLKGWIFGNANQKQWTQTLYRKKYRFQNPLHQNYKHIKAVQNLLGVRKSYIFSIVVFVGNSQFKTEMPSNVVELREFLPYVRSHDRVIFSGEDIEAFSQKLNNPVYFDSSNRNKHIKNIQNNLQKPDCPRCGKQMVLRTARKGSAIGSKFWGCSGFPKCKATKKVA
ncbi:MAG: NERD domain-containing protein [Gammaproteobacteria bacterium]|nr:NERD domain-containing protein [Gammaproteobacteria bacterium]